MRAGSVKQVCHSVQRKAKEADIYTHRTDTQTHLLMRSFFKKHFLAVLSIYHTVHPLQVYNSSFVFRVDFTCISGTKVLDQLVVSQGICTPGILQLTGLSHLLSFMRGQRVRERRQPGSAISPVDKDSLPASTPLYQIHGECGATEQSTTAVTSYTIL